MITVKYFKSVFIYMNLIEPFKAQPTVSVAKVCRRRKYQFMGMKGIIVIEDTISRVRLQ
jgi:hypothetical protein